MAIRLAKRDIYKLDSFRGFDFSSSPVNASPKFAIKGKNFILRNGVNSKRNGYNEITRLSRLQAGEVIYSPVDSIFQFTLDGNEFIICYSGRRFYQILGEGDFTYSYEITNTSSRSQCLVNPMDLSANKLFMFRLHNAIYFVGAGKLISFKKYGDDYELRYVEENTDVFVPITSINISPLREENLVEEFEERNILTAKRINKLKPTNLLHGQSLSWQLDSDYVDLSKDFLVKIGYQYNDRIVSDIFRKNSLNHLISDTSGWDFGEITEGGVITLNNTEDMLNVVSYIDVEFYSSRSLMADKINKCKIGTLFGVNGRMDRLFIAKNGIADNEDYMSESDDFTYFKESSYSKIGSEDSKIMAYTLLNDGTLAIQKESVGTEAGIYYRTSTYKTVFGRNGEISYIETYFPLKVGSIGEGVVSSYANSSLGEEKLFLSQNGVFALTLPESPTTNNRYAKERSYYINDKLLTSNNLDKAFSIVHDNKYFLVVDDGVYIADMRYVTRNNSVMSDTYNFDWWYWDNIPASCMQVINGKLWFGTTDGRICVFDDTFTDKTYFNTSEGDILINYTDNEVVFNQDINITDGTSIEFKRNVFFRLFDSNEVINNDSGRLYVPEEKFFMIDYGAKAVIKYSGDNNLYTGYIRGIDYTNHSFCLYDNGGNIINPGNNEYSVDIALINKKLKIKIDNGYTRLTFLRNDHILKLSENSDSSNMVTARILQKKNVVAEWFTPMLDFGFNNMDKTLLKISFTTHSEPGSALEIGYNTRCSSYMTQSDDYSEFNINNLDFTRFTFLTSFASSYTVDVKEDFNYIQFYVKSDTDSDCKLEKISLVYKFNKYTRGSE